MGDYNPNSRQVETTTAPPKAVDVLERIFSNQRKRSDQYPPRTFDAAHWWIDHQEPANELTERVEQVTDKNGKKFWKTPYIDRIAGTLRIFLSLADTHKAFVIQKIEQGIPWRGDDMDMFLKICAEEEKIKRDRNGYICAAQAVYSGFKKEIAA